MWVLDRERGERGERRREEGKERERERHTLKFICSTIS